MLRWFGLVWGLGGPGKRRIIHENSKQKGDQLEIRVEKMYKRMLKFNVKRHNIIRDHHGNISGMLYSA